MLTHDVCYSLVQCQTYWWTAGIQNLIPLGHPVRGGGDYNFTDPSQAQNLSITKFFRPNPSTVFTSQRQTERHTKRHEDPHIAKSPFVVGQSKDKTRRWCHKNLFYERKARIHRPRLWL